MDGTFQQYAIGKAAHVARIPEDVALDAVSPILCAGITVYKGLKESGARAGESVAIVGAGGGLGSLACQYAKAMGLRVIGVDTGDDKAKMVTEQLGAAAFVDFAKSKDVVADVKNHTSDKTGPHAVLVVAVSEKPFQQAVEYVRPRGTVVAIGLPSNATAKSDVFSMVTQMKTIKGSYVGNRRDTAEAIDFFARGLIKAPFKTVGMSELGRIYEEMGMSSCAICVRRHFWLTTLQSKVRLLGGMSLTRASRRYGLDPALRPLAKTLCLSANEFKGLSRQLILSRFILTSVRFYCALYFTLFCSHFILQLHQLEQPSSPFRFLRREPPNGQGYVDSSERGGFTSGAGYQ